MARRTHSEVDKLPDEIRMTLMRMIVDGYWPDDFPASHDGKPTYDEMVEYIVMQGYSISRSSLNRWGQKLNVLEVMSSRDNIVRSIMAEGENAEDFADSQRAAAKLINARVLEAAMNGKLSSKETRELASAVKDCARIAIDTDQYRQKIEARTKAAAESVTEKLTKKNVDPETLRIVREDIFGIYKT